MNLRPTHCAVCAYCSLKTLFGLFPVTLPPVCVKVEVRELNTPPPFIFAVLPVTLPAVMVSLPPLLMPPLLYSVARLPLMVAPASVNCAAGLSE